MYFNPQREHFEEESRGIVAFIHFKKDTIQTEQFEKLRKRLEENAIWQLVRHGLQQIFFCKMRKRFKTFLFLKLK